MTSLYVDVTGSTPAVVLALRATLLDDAGEVRLSREFDRTELADTADAPDAVRAFNAALQGMLGELAREISAR